MHFSIARVSQLNQHPGVAKQTRKEFFTDSERATASAQALSESMNKQVRLQDAAYKIPPRRQETLTPPVDYRIDSLIEHKT